MTLQTNRFVHFRKSSSAESAFPAATLQTSPLDCEEAAIRLDVPQIYQLPELRNGCEITSATMLLNYYGFLVDKCQMADDYLPKLYPYITADPEEGYMGDPYTLWGYYCMTKPIVTAINDYLTSYAVPLWQAEDISGVTINQIRDYIAHGFPVQVWVTRNFSAPTYYDTFSLPNGNQPYANLHCVVIVGMSESAFYLNDPLDGSYSVPVSTFESVFSSLGSRAVYLRKNRD